MKRTLLFISIIALIGVGVFQLVLVPTRAQQAVTDEVTIIPLPIATNFIGTDVRGVSSDGKRIVFDSINNYNGNNVDSNVEIYVYDVDSRSLIQITDTKNLTDPADSTKITLNVNNYSPAISGDGTKIAFVSNASLGGTTNDDGNFEIYLADLPLGSSNFTIKRITNTDKNYDAEVVKEAFSNYTPTLNNDGTVISFVSTRTVELSNGVFRARPHAVPGLALGVLEGKLELDDAGATQTRGVIVLEDGRRIEVRGALRDGEAFTLTFDDPAMPRLRGTRLALAPHRR